jgi:hypothetical protein
MILGMPGFSTMSEFAPGTSITIGSSFFGSIEQACIDAAIYSCTTNAERGTFMLDPFGDLLRGPLMIKELLSDCVKY